MSRSRNIKPGFFRNEILVELPFEFRLLFIGTWTHADRAGRFEDRPHKIKMELFPADDVDVDVGLQALHDKGFIRRYSIAGVAYCEIISWAKHQNPHHREALSTIPAPNIPEACPRLELGEPEACLGHAQDEPDTSRADSLIPDSLIPDSGSKKKPHRERQSTPSPTLDLPEWLPADAWRDWCEYRRSMKGRFTDKAKALNLRRLGKLHAEGHDARAVIELAIERGWTGLFASIAQPAPSTRHSPHTANENFEGRGYVGTSVEQLPPELRRAVERGASHG